jgi:PAS domain S-box-containing protein
MNEAFHLLESELRFRSLFENNPDAVVFQNKAGVILDANPAALALLNQPREELINRHINDFLPPDKQALFHEKLVEAFRGTKVQFETDVQFRGAEPKVLSVTKVPLWVEDRVAGVHMVARDITEMAASQNLIRQQARTLNTIFESITDAFFLLDKHWAFRSVNTEVERLLGVSREQLLGKFIWDAFPAEVMRPFYAQYQQGLAANNAAHFEAYFEPRQLWLEVKAFPSEEGLSVYFSNITDKVLAHQELYRQNNDLQQFAYIVSHNLRAPLSNMLGLVDLLASGDKAAPEYNELLAHLSTSTQQLDTVLRDMNTILTIRDKQDVTKAELVPLAETVGQVLQNLQEMLHECAAEVTLDIPAGLQVHGNRAYLYSIFFNLLSNAVKYRSAERPLRITVTATPTAPGPGAQIVVADNGSGFDMQRAGNDVFKLYKRFHAQPVGRGMGLYLVKTHVEAMGGRIEVQSEVNVGTRFILQLS